MTKVLAAAFGALAAACLVPAAAHAAPVCKETTVLLTPTGAPLTLPAPDCTGIVGAYTTTFTQPPQSGALSAGPPFVYSPAAGFHDVEEIRYTITDQTGTSNVATLLIAVDTAPTCADTALTVEHNGTGRLPFPCDDADAQDDVFISFTNGRNGSVTFDEQTGELIYTPNPGFAGTDSFTYSAEDDFGLESGVHRATVTVKPAPIIIRPPVRVPGPPPAPPKDVTAPVAALKSAAKPLKQTLSKGLALLLETNEASTVKLTVTVDKATARKLKLDRKAKGPVTVGSIGAALAPGAPTVTVAFTAKAKRAFKAVKKLKVTVTAVVSDAAGNQVTRTLSVSLKR